MQTFTTDSEKQILQFICEDKKCTIEKLEKNLLQICSSDFKFNNYQCYIDDEMSLFYLRVLDNLKARF